MKYFLNYKFAAFSAILLTSGCEKATNELVGSSYEDAVPVEQKPAVIDREPISNTSPPGSHMAPVSNAYIVFDGSGSMAGEPIEQAKRAVTAFVKGAPEELNIGLYVFDANNESGREVIPLGRGESQRQKITDQIQKIQAGGGTPLGSAIEVGTNSLIKQFQKQLRYGDIRLIVVTDGAANDQHKFNESIRFANKYHVPIYTVGFRIRNSHPLRQHSESYFTANDEQQLLNAMNETLAELDDSTSLDL